MPLPELQSLYSGNGYLEIHPDHHELIEFRFYRAGKDHRGPACVELMLRSVDDGATVKWFFGDVAINSMPLCDGKQPLRLYSNASRQWESRRKLALEVCEPDGSDWTVLSANSVSQEPRR